MRDSVFVPANNNSFFIALIELHTQVRRTNYFLDCVTSEMLRHLVSASHRSGVRPELAVSPLMALSPPPSLVQSEAAELRGVRISSLANNLSRQICLRLVHYQLSRQA